jgi:putative ABC transport system ATP-binding protein
MRLVNETVEPAAAVLALERVVRTHGQGPNAVRALGPVSLEVKAGELVAIMGPSGSGKTTLLSLAGALDRPTEGTVRVLGRDLAALTPGALAELRRTTVGYVFQELNLLPGLTALENVALPLELEGRPVREARREAVAALARVRMDTMADRFPEDLSGGEQQRVAIARSFVGPRALLLADEPTGALDSVTGERIVRHLRTFCDDGRTVVMVTHDATIAAWADRVLFLKDGRIDEQAVATRGFRPSEVATEP